jgi:hypothetical protein
MRELLDEERREITLELVADRANLDHEMAAVALNDLEPEIHHEAVLNPTNQPDPSHHSHG